MENELKKRLTDLGQPHLLRNIKSLSEKEIQCCLAQIDGWSAQTLQEEQNSWQKRSQPLHFEPLTDCPTTTPIQTAVKNTAVLILAGGQGSRLGFQGPKGCFSILGKSLFERHCEKIKNADIPVAILTSPLNHQETFSFFQEHQLFGLHEVNFFSQKTLPLFDESGRWFWDGPGHIAEGADGNGSVFSALEESGLLQYFIDCGVETVHIVPVDNPLADPLDPILSAFHEKEKADLTIKCIRLMNPHEPTGRLVQMNHRLMIAEFAELSEGQREQNLYANTGLLAIRISLMRYLSQQKFPYHWAWRSTAAGRLAWKAEQFIVDALLYAQNSRSICYPRESCFAPLKDKSSIAEIEQALQDKF